MVTHVTCRECDTHVEGRFIANGATQLKPEQQAFVDKFVSRLQPEQLTFIETFVRCEGKIKTMEAQLGLSYPTIRNRLDEVIRALGYEPDEMEEPAAGITEERRLGILDKLNAGQISAEDAMRMLAESEG